MAVITNTYLVGSATGKQNRETLLRDTIEGVDPTETPVFSMIGRENVEGVKPEWVQSSLAVPNPDNAQLEGDQYTYGAVNQPVRVGNYTQIFRKEGIVSKSQEEALKVGKQSEIGRAKRDKGLELRTDIEVSILSNNASVSGNTRKSAGLRAWTAANDLMGVGGASGGYNTGTGVVDAATNGTQRAFTKALMDAALLAAYTNGGNPTAGIMSPYAKSVFSSFMSDANVAQQRMAASDRDQATIVGAADMYISDWGKIGMVPNRQLARAGANYARNIFFITPDMLAKGFFRDIREDPNITPNADATVFVLICEFTLINRHEKAHAVIADVFGMTAAT